MVVDNAVRSPDQVRVQRILFFTIKRYIFDCLKLIFWVEYSATDEYLILFLIPILDLKLIVDLFAVRYFLDEVPFFVDDFNWIPCLVSDNIVRNKF